MKSRMQEMEVFVAFDGSIFLDEDDCSIYEERLSAYNFLENNKDWKDWIKQNFRYVEDIVQNNWKP